MSSRKVVHNSAGLVLRTVEVFTTELTAQEIKKCRADNKLEELIPSIRKCLRCDAEFHSAGKHNRICDYCKLDFSTIPTGICDYNFHKYRSISRYTLERRMKKQCYS